MLPMVLMLLVFDHAAAAAVGATQAAPHLTVTSHLMLLGVVLSR